MCKNNFASEFVLVLTTESNLKSAEELAKKILGRQLAACVSLKTIQSYYWWDGKIQDEEEVQLLIKTNRENMDELLNVLEELHSYAIPELILLNARTSRLYFNWMNSVLKDSSEEPKIIIKD